MDLLRAAHKREIMDGRRNSIGRLALSWKILKHLKTRAVCARREKSILT